jgi:beta-ureidopropionase / N-carbamoyl-L-amino-acid hydrolase
MIFIPCNDGISYNEIEDERAERLALGADALLNVMLARAGIAN